MILGFYHVYVGFATDERFDVPDRSESWQFDEEFSAWIVEQMIRHHEHYFDEFERIEETPEEFNSRHGLDEE